MTRRPTSSACPTMQAPPALCRSRTAADPLRWPRPPPTTGAEAVSTWKRPACWPMPATWRCARDRRGTGAHHRRHRGRARWRRHPVSLGGDHSGMAYPSWLRSACHPGLTLVQVGAHPDLYDSFEGDRFARVPFARIMEERLVARLVQVGIRTLNGHQRAGGPLRRGDRRHVRMGGRRPPSVPRPIHLSIDLDGLDPAFAPGVAHCEARRAESARSHRFDPVAARPIAGADIVGIIRARTAVASQRPCVPSSSKEVAARTSKRRHSIAAMIRPVTTVLS